MWTKILSNRASSPRHQKAWCVGQIALKSLFGFFILILVGAFSLMILPALAWTEPTAAPPGGNVSPPLNTSDVAQTKSGSLLIEGDSATGKGLRLGKGALELTQGENLVYGLIHDADAGNFLLFQLLGEEIFPTIFKVTTAGDVTAAGSIIADGLTVDTVTSTTVCIGVDCKTAWPAGGSGTPGGSNTQVQFNDSGVFGGATGFVWDKVNSRVGIGTTTPAYRLTVPWITGDAAATAYFGSSNASNNQIAVFGESYSGIGVHGQSSSSIGVDGESDGGVGVQGQSIDGVGVYGYSTRSYGVQSLSIDGVGVYGESTNSYAGHFNITPATTNTVAEILRLQRSVSGTAANGIGGSTDWYLEDSVGTAELSGRISNLLTTATSGSETSALTFWTRTDGAAIAERVRIDGAGSVGIGETVPGYPLDIKNSSATGTAEIRLNQNNATALWTGLALARQSAEKWYVGMDNATDATANSLLFRRDGTTNDMTIGTDGTVKIAGQIKISGGSPGLNKVLTSDADGLATWQTPAASSGGSPVGTIVMYGAAAAPTGWLLCNGSLVDTTMYADLFAVIGYTYGGIGPRFGVPNLQEKFPKGYFSGGINQLGDTGGQTSAMPTFTGNALGTHQHAAITAGTPAGTNSIPIFTGTLGTTAAANTGATAYGPTASTVTLKAHTHTITPAGTVSAPTFTGNALGAHQHAAISAGTPSGSVSAISTEPPYIVINYIIYAGAGGGDGGGL